MPRLEDVISFVRCLKHYWAMHKLECMNHRVQRKLALIQQLEKKIEDPIY